MRGPPRRQMISYRVHSFVNPWHIDEAREPSSYSIQHSLSLSVSRQDRQCSRSLDWKPVCLMTASVDLAAGRLGRSGNP